MDEKRQPVEEVILNNRWKDDSLIVPGSFQSLCQTKVVLIFLDRFGDVDAVKVEAFDLCRSDGSAK